MFFQMKTTALPPLIQLPNGVVIPTEELIIAIHEEIIKYRRELGKEDTPAIRDPGLIRHLCDTLKDRMKKYKEDPLENALYVATETFYYIACQHPFHDGNKSTAYIVALLVLRTNYFLNRIQIEAIKADGVKRKILPYISTFNLPYKNKEFVSAPKEAEEITRLAEGGKNDVEIKKLIREFLVNQMEW